ncbi:hypothetical protein BT63DRAFT_393492 [Microthyrium microscopicum]|uniref:U3 small nucleolar RNA-associated protein 10 n=1 Tax=Microthyrium microscopicum TaxID=703497 RepID=A0A6A6TW27_9PEZI|nr:hypothetical protein BT63DRAFT_393492 [Microthyrium microscopicum]
MASALQKQLAAIAAKSTHQLDLKAQRAAHGKSLLFDPKHAVTQNFDSLYQICLEGFSDLCMLDPRFIPFSNNIFSEQSIDEEREQMTATQNEELNSVLQAFLGLVSSSLLLKPGQKAIEWTIRRFRVHEYNTEDLILCFLPYHTTHLFVKLLSILPQNIPQTCKFIQPYISSLSSPPIRAISYSATNTPAFFSLLNQHILRIARAKCHSSALLSFWSSIATQAVEGMLTGAQSGIATIRKERTENALLQIIPVLNDALAIKGIPELDIAVFMIIIILAARADMNDETVDSLMEAVTMNWDKTTANLRFICLAALAQERHSKKLSKPVAKRLVAVDGLFDGLSDISTTYRASKLIQGLMLRCIDRLKKPGGQKEFGIIRKGFESKLLSQKEYQKVLQSLITVVLLWNYKNLAQPEELDWNALQDVGEFFNSITLPIDLSDSQKQDLQKLELLLQVSIIPEDVEPEQSALPSVEPERPATPMEIDFEGTILESDISGVSFLDGPHSSGFNKIASLFGQAARNSVDLHSFIEQGILRKNGAQTGDTRYVTLLVRIACSERPVSVRSTALKLLADELDALFTAEWNCQVILPYLISGLADQSAQIRRGAAQCIVKFSKPTDNQPKAQIWGDNKIYSEGSATKLSQEHTLTLVKSILSPKLEECILSAETIFAVFTSSLSSTDSKKTNSSHSEPHAISKLARADICDFLAGHAALTGIMSVKSQLVVLLNSLGKAALNAQSTIILPFIKRWSTLSPANVELACNGQGVKLETINQHLLQSITHRDAASLQYLAELVLTPKDRQDLIAPSHARLIELWTTLDIHMRQAVLIEFTTISLRPRNSKLDNAPEQAKTSLRNLPLTSDDLGFLLSSLPKATNMPAGPAAKRRRTSQTRSSRPEQAPKETIEALRGYNLVLELVDSCQPAQHPQLLGPLFEVLNELQVFSSQTNNALIYLKSSTINSLFAIVDKLKNTKEVPKDKTAIRTDLVVDTIRTTSNIQLQNEALLLVSCLAVWIPEVVLHSVMPIFTLMGTTILRQGDDYSAHVIDQTVSRVVPPLVASLKKRSREVVSGVSDLLVSFTAAFEHIPSHRRLVLFQHVVEALGPKDCLFAVVCMILNQHRSDFSARQFVIDLVNQFDAEIQLGMLIQSVDLIADIFRPRRSMSEVVLNIKEKKEMVDQITAQNLIEALSELLTSSVVRSKIAESFDFGSTDSEAQQKRFTQLMSGAIGLMQLFKGKTCEGASKELLSSVFRVLPVSELIGCAKMLLSTSTEEVRIILIQSASSQVNSSRLSDQKAATAFLEFIPDLSQVISQAKSVQEKSSSISCIHQIAKLFGKLDSSQVLSAVSVILGDTCIGSGELSLQVQCLSALASMIKALKEDMLPHITSILTITDNLLQNDLQSDQPSSELHDMAFTVINAVGDTLPFLLTGRQLDSAIHLAQLSSNKPTDQPTSTRDHFYQIVAERVDPAEAFAAIERNFEWTLNNQGFDAIVDYYKLVKGAISAHSKSNIIKNATVLLKFVKQAMNIRALKAADDDNLIISATEAEDLELLIIDVALSLVLKLNDAIFRPFFIQLVDWAVFQPTQMKPASVARATTLFHFLKALLFRLKGLMTGYMSYVLEFISNLLQSDLTVDELKQALLVAMLGSARQSFDCDEDEFWQSPSHFTAIAKPLLSLLGQKLGAITNDSVIPAITSFAVAAASNDHLKVLNTDILHMFRAESPFTRLAAVKCQHSLTEELGEEWLAHLPEMLPFMTEMLEDDDEKVERETRSWIRSVEKIMGESLDNMLQ